MGGVECFQLANFCLQSNLLTPAVKGNEPSIARFVYQYKTTDVYKNTIERLIYISLNN